MKKNINKNVGMSLVEVLVAVSIFVVIFLLLTLFTRDMIAFSKFSNDSITSSSDARAILRTMVAEIRGASPSSNGSYAIEQAGTSTLIFYSDIDEDGLKERIRYVFSNTKLERGETKPSGNPVTYNTDNEKIVLLARDMKNAPSNPVFEYFDGNYAGTSTPLSYPINITSIRMIKINLYLEADPNKAPVPRLYTSQGMLRNLKDNL